MTLKLPTTFRGIDGKTAYEKIINTKTEIPKQETPTAKSNVFSNSDFWTIDNVLYKNKICKVNLLKNLLDNGNAKTQDEWAEYSINAKKKNDFYCGDMPLQYATFEALCNSPNSKEKEEARNFIQKNMREKYLMTLTRTQYLPGKNALDKVIHNYKIPNEEYFKEAKIVGPDREIISDDKDALEALLLTKDIDKIKSVFNWINQTPTYIWRLNSQPKNLDERVAWFDAGPGRAGLNCGRNSSDRDPSLGVKED